MFMQYLSYNLVNGLAFILYESVKMNQFEVFLKTNILSHVLIYSNVV